MSNQRRPTLLTFHRTGPMTCPYLPDRVEQQLFAELSGPDAQILFNQLSLAGFRRSHHIAYRPVCKGCQACIPVRIPVARFRWNRAFRKVMNRNTDLTLRDAGRRAGADQYDLFARYVRSRHGDGDMAGMTARDFANLVMSSPVDTTMLELRDPQGRLVAACLCDRLEDGYSAVYSFFEPAEERRGLGNLMILRLIDLAAREGLPHVYLGFWVPGSRKMDYKRRFRPMEMFDRGRWTELTAGDAPDMNDPSNMS